MSGFGRVCRLNNFICTRLRSMNSSKCDELQLTSTRRHEDGTQFVALSKKDNLYKDAMETCSQSEDRELAEELLTFFVDKVTCCDIYHLVLSRMLPLLFDILKCSWSFQMILTNVRVLLSHRARKNVLQFACTHATISSGLI